jgi:myosin heavy subunit
LQRQLGDAQTERDQARGQFREAQQNLNRAQEQLRNAQQERDQAREQLRKLQQEPHPTQEQLRKAQQDLNRTQEQLRKAQQERNRAQTQLRNALQEHNSTQEQLTITQEERDQAQEELAQLREQLRQGQQGYERGQSSRGDSRVEDALPTTIEGMQEQLEGEHRRQQELFERVLQLQEGIQRTLLDCGEDVPRTDRLNELLRQGIWNLVGYHRLDEMLFPRQEFGELPGLRQRVRNFYLQTVSESTSLGLSQGQIAMEFVDQLRDQLAAHDRPNQELIDTSEDIQEEAYGRRPNRTQR